MGTCQDLVGSTEVLQGPVFKSVCYGEILLVSFCGAWLEIFNDPYILLKFCSVWQQYGKSIWPFWPFRWLITLGTEAQGYVALPSMSNSTALPSAAPALQDGLKLQTWDGGFL